MSVSACGAFGRGLNYPPAPGIRFAGPDSMAKSFTRMPKGRFGKRPLKPKQAYCRKQGKRTGARYAGEKFSRPPAKRGLWVIWTHSTFATTARCRHIAQSPQLWSAGIWLPVGRWGRSHSRNQRVRVSSVCVESCVQY
jgi:hypothetical protein